MEVAIRIASHVAIRIATATAGYPDYHFGGNLIFFFFFDLGTLSVRLRLLFYPFLHSSPSFLRKTPQKPQTNRSPALDLYPASHLLVFPTSLTISFTVLFCLRLRRGWRHHCHITTASTPRDSLKPELAPSIIASLSTFAYQNAIDHSGNDTSVQCAVCLGQAQEGEIVRLLPKCRHLFHVECIDMWLYSHSTCPLCRSEVVDTPEAVEKVEVGEASTPPELPV